MLELLHMDMSSPYPYNLCAHVGNNKTCQCEVGESWLSCDCPSQKCFASGIGDGLKMFKTAPNLAQAGNSTMGQGIVTS